MTLSSLAQIGGGTIPIEVRAAGTPDRKRSDVRRPATSHPYPYSYCERRGWPTAVPPTTPTAYVSGYMALNLPATEDHPEPGDWNTLGTWWSPCFLDVYDRPPVTELWGDGGTKANAPVTPRLRDARPALATMCHPAADHPSPILAATVQQAIVDLAWSQLGDLDGRPHLDRHMIARWCGRDDEDSVLCQLVREVEEAITDPEYRCGWRHWRIHSVEGDDEFRFPVIPDIGEKPLPPPIVITYTP